MIGLSFVAFIDILGFGDMVTADCESANPGELYLPNLKSAIHETLAHAQSVEAKITQFSDSIVVSSPFSPNASSFQSFADLVRSLQSLLFSNRILCRGGISHGRHFHDETLLFSQALIDAYELESKVAVNPRIVISKDTLELIYPLDIKISGSNIDDDGQFFLDYLDGISVESVVDILRSLEHSLKSDNPRVKSKISWLFKYANFRFAEIDVPDHITMRRA